ncbi:MAG: hypothetical protein AAFQ63_17845 [Cyanobacteria bacterium J06621_11]
MIPTLGETTACQQGASSLSVSKPATPKPTASVDISRHSKQKKSQLSRNFFDYRIHISWFGGVQIHPKF